MPLDKAMCCTPEDLVGSLVEDMIIALDRENYPADFLHCHTNNNPVSLTRKLSRFYNTFCTHTDISQVELASNLISGVCNYKDNQLEYLPRIPYL